jgi:hypothetical protein
LLSGAGAFDPQLRAFINSRNLLSQRSFEARKVRDLAVLQQLSLDLQNRAINVVLDLVDLPTLPLNVRHVNIGTRPSE